MKKKMTRKITGLLLAGMLTVSCLSGCTEIPPETLDYLEQAALSLTETAAENNLFDITMPAGLEGSYVIESTANGCSVYDKEAKEAGFGGFAFSVSAYEKPSDYAGGMDKKVGEIIDGDTVLYDIVVGYPSDVQYDWEKYGEGMPETYEALYHGAEDIVKTLQPKQGGEFIFGSGCKGEELYPAILEKYVTAVKEGWDPNKLEAENMSPEYYGLSQIEGENAMDLIGFAYLDLNQDGVDELLIGEMGGGAYNTTVYDIYTIVDRAPAPVVSGSARNRYYPLEYGMFVNERSGGADDSEWITYDIEPNTTNLLPQIGLKMDGYADKEKPWFVIYGADEDGWEPISEEDFNFHMENLKYLRTDFTPLSRASEGGLKEPAYKTFKSSLGWSVTYDADVISCMESTDPAGETDFNYIGECAGTNLLSVSFTEGKLPNDVIEEIKDVQEKDTKTNISGVFFPGTADKWGYWVNFEYAQKGSGYMESCLLTEYNGGTLIFRFIEHKAGKDEIDIPVSDAFALIIDSLEFENFGPQTMYDGIPGTYKGAEEKIILKEDHTGTLSIQDDIDILWDEAAIMAADGSFQYHYTLKGDKLTLDYDGQELVLQKN